MKNTLKYLEHLNQKSLTSLKVRNTNLKRLEKIAQIQMNTRPPGKFSYEELDLSIYKDTSLPSLGPGSYNTPPPDSGQGVSFGYVTRFKLSPCQFKSTQSTNKIKQNKRMIIHTPEFRQKKLDHETSEKRLKEYISREAKKIIQSERLLKIKDHLKEKFSKPEMSKLRTAKKQVALSYTQMLLVFLTAQEIKKKISKRKSYKTTIHKYLMSVAVICRAFGKFKMYLKKAKMTVAYRVIKKHLPRILKKTLAIKREKYLKTMLDVLENFSKHVGIARINYMLDCKIRVIQRCYRNFRCVNQHRKHVLRLLWEKLDRKASKVNENIKHYYISSYLTQRFEDFILKKNKMNRQYSTFITTDLEKLRESGELPKREKIDLPIFRIFIEKHLKKLVLKAWNDREKWPGINYPDFPMGVEKKKKKTVIKLSPFRVSRKTTVKAKRGVAFALDN